MTKVLVFVGNDVGIQAIWLTTKLRRALSQNLHLLPLSHVSLLRGIGFTTIDPSLATLAS